MLLVGGALVWVVAVMFVLWLVQLRTGNAAIVDAGWTFSVAFSHLYFAAHAGGDPRRSWLLAALVSIWAVRLGGYLFLTRVVGKVEEEGRYVELRRQWGRDAQRNLLLFFLAQGLLAVLLAAPFLPCYAHTSAAVHPRELLGVAMFLVGLLGVSRADAQLSAFKRRGQKGVCREGLWSWSRHPNYFFETLLWFGWAVYAWGSPGGTWAFISPCLILYFVLFVTGIPPTEAQSLRSKGEAYRDYQRTTSAFIPWPPRRHQN